MFENERIKEIIIDSDGTQKTLYPNCIYTRDSLDGLYYPEFHVTWDNKENGLVCPHCGNIEINRVNWCSGCRSRLIAVFP